MAIVRGPRSIARLLLLVLALAAALPAAARPPRERVERLKALSLEQLLAVEVTSASKIPRTLWQLPAAVSVIPQEEIRRSGARSIPEALRLATGLHVARFDSRTWSVSARGLNAPTSNKMLVLIDGRSVYTPLFSGVFWDVQDYLLADVDRIEVVRGPGAALWGSNAVNGVVNIITKPAAETQGGLLQAGGGSEHTAFGALRWGGEVTAGEYRVYGTFRELDALAFADGRSARDDLRFRQGGFRADLRPAADDRLTLQGDVYSGRIGHPVRDVSDVEGGNLGLRWRTDLAGAGHVEARLFFDATERVVPGQFAEDRETWDLELEHEVRLGRHELVWGAGYRRSDDRVADSPVFAWEPNAAELWILNLFAQDTIRLDERWQLVVGTKLEEQSVMDLEVQPTLRLAFTPDEEQILWAAASRAVRAPTRIDRDVRVPGEPPFLVVGNPDWKPEEVVAYELGHRRLFANDLFLDTTAFYNEYDDVRSQEPSAGGLPLVLGNGLEGETYGLELAAGYAPLERLELHGGVTWLHSELRPEPGSGDLTGGAAEANDPDFHGFLRADLELPRGFVAGAWLRYVDDLAQPAVPAYAELDLRLAWRPRPDLEISLVGQNLLHDHHPEFGSLPGREEIERGVYGELLWSF
jgi:iron complex outermembrane receptor protein